MHSLAGPGIDHPYTRERRGAVHHVVARRNIAEKVTSKGMTIATAELLLFSCCSSTGAVQGTEHQYIICFCTFASLSLPSVLSIRDFTRRFSQSSCWDLLMH